MEWGGTHEVPIDKIPKLRKICSECLFSVWLSTSITHVSNALFDAFLHTGEAHQYRLGKSLMENEIIDL